MHTTPEVEHITKLVQEFKTQRSWIEEVNGLAQIIDELNNINKVISVRELSRLVSKSKSWVGVSLILIRGLRIYPELEKLRNRNQAYAYIRKKNKLKGFLEHG